MAGSLLLAACDPVLHPTVTTRAVHGSGVEVELLAGDASHVVLSATTGSDVVPGPGNWRVDRHDGSVDELPTGDPVRISADGERILFGSSTGTLWSAGAEVTKPSSGTVLSEDLTFGLYVEDGIVHRWDVRTGETSVVDDGSDWPAPYVRANAVSAISDDGTVAVYRLAGDPFGSTYRILNTATGTATDVHEPVTLSASGAVAAHLHEEYTDEIPPVPDELWLELIDTATGEVIRHHDLEEYGAYPRDLLLSDDGRVAWLLFGYSEIENCWWQSPSATVCSYPTEAVVLRHGTGRKRFPVADFGLGGDYVETSITPDGRFLTFSLDAGPGEFPVYVASPQIIDWITNTDEALSRQLDTGGWTSTAVAPQISDDGRLVVTSATPLDGVPPQQASVVGGWYEFTPAEE